MTTRFRWLNVLLDSVALIIALAVDLTLNVICMAILAPGPLETVGFIAIAFVVVLFAVRSWIIGNKALWAIFALVSFFFDLSFTLISTDVQTSSQAVVITVENDSELAYLTKKAATSAEELAGLQEQYRLAMKRETMDQLDAMIQKAERTAQESEAARAARRRRIETGELNAQARRERAVITAAMIFDAIRGAAIKGRVIPIAVFGAIFAGLQLVMVTAANAIRGKPGRQPPARRRPRQTAAPAPVVEHSLIRRWVSLNWIGARNGKSNAILPRHVFFDFVKKNNEAITAAQYDTILKAALTQGVLKKSRSTDEKPIDIYIIMQYDEIKATGAIADVLAAK